MPETADILTPERFREIRQAFESVVDLPSFERRAILSQASDVDPELAKEVRRLVSAYGRRGAFIERPPAGPDRQPNIPGDIAGAYTLLHLIGEGGMGEVWCAEQKYPVERRVAVKLIKSGMATREVIARFESERRALALMEHPAIARVFDAGSTLNGRPWFAMEYVVGVPITAYCSQRNLSLRARLKLFLQVCDGVQHAHQKAVIHRDLKPSNILVTEIDGRPVPKVIDFGVARAVTEPLTKDAFFTRAGMILGTPDYMSPEQGLASADDIDTRSDVYSLGVILYELLSGALPLDFRKLPLDEVLRRLREDEPARPSARLRNQDQSAVLARDLRGDLDAITLKALEKDRTRRYETPSALAADIGRYLRNEPVTARPASVIYQVRKYVRRHRAGVAAATLLFILLASFGIAEAVQLRRITRERDRAARITSLMTGMFRISSPGESMGNKVTARELLDKASKNLGTQLADDPELQAQMMDAMGKVYYNLGLYPRAESLLDSALRTRRRILGSDSPQTAQSINMLANVLHSEGRTVEVQNLYREALAIRRRVLGPDHRDTMWSMNNWAVSLSDVGRYNEAEKVYAEVLATRRRVLGPEHPDTLTSINNWGISLIERGNFAEAEILVRNLIQLQTRVLGKTNPATLLSGQNLGWLLDNAGRYSEAEKNDREVLDNQRAILGPEHPATLMSADNLADVLGHQGRHASAEKLYRETLGVQRRLLGPENPDVLYTTTNLAAFLAAQRKFEAAQKLQREVLAVRARQLGPEHPLTLYAKSKLARTLVLKGELSEAETLARETQRAQLDAIGPNHPDLADTTCTLAMIAARNGRREEALSLLHDAVDHGLRFSEVSALQKNPAFESLRADPRFRHLVSSVMPLARRHNIE